MVHEPLKSAEPRIPGYRIESVLGRGATGTVYRARQESVDRVVALKVLHEDLVGTRAERRLQREARTTARLAHPNIISAIDMGVDARGRWWYAMELVDGENLLDRIRTKPLSEREALRVFIPLCEALQHAFERGVVHRDLKPANVLLERGGRALIVDLGLAAAEDDPSLTRGGGTLGTPHYISPEQARDPRSADVQSDLWSLGATLYHALCGRPPFDGDSVAEILSNVLYARVQDPRRFAPELSPGMVLVLRKCLTRDRARRYATPAELSADLERLRERRAPEVVAGAVDPLAGDGRPRALVVGAAVAGVVAVGALAWFLFRPAPKGPGDGVADAPLEEDPLDAVARGVEGEPRGLSAAWDVILRARASPLEGQRAVRARDLEARLRQRLDDELVAFKRAANERFLRWLQARDFPAAEEFAARGARSELAQILGARTVPESVERELSGWTAELEKRLDQAEIAANEAYLASAERWWSSVFAPAIDADLARGDWLAARDRLLQGRAALLATAGLDARGVAADTIARVEELVDQRLEQRRARLDQDWNQLDRDLRRFVESKAEELATKTEDRTQTAPASALSAAWEQELAARKLDPARFPGGLFHEALETLASSRAALQALEDRQAADDARFYLAELEAETRPLWKARRFAEAAQRYELFADEAWSAPVKVELKLVAREARLLDELLLRAAQGVRARDGKLVELRLSTVPVTGRLDAGVDSQTRAFRLVSTGSREWTLALRELESEAGPAPAVVPPDVVELFVRAASNGALEPRYALALGLLRWREGDANGARAALGNALPDGEPLVARLSQRLAEAGAGEARAEAGTLREVRQRLRLLGREAESAQHDPALEKRIDDFLAKYGEVLGVDELAALRQARERMAGPKGPLGPDAFAKAFRLPTSAVRFESGTNRVTLQFACGGREESAFELGQWVRDGRGWSPAETARDVDDLFARRVPTLPLGDPLRVANGPIDVALDLEQPEGVPPELFVLTVAGFHVVLAGAHEGVAARVLADTGDPARIVERMRNGEGRPFPGWKAGQRVELHLVLQRATRAVQLEIDGRRVLDTWFAQAPAESAPLVLQVRAWERLRLLALELQAGRR